ncbi:MAG TPA: pectin acetylesterase-family hydrolase [Kofleriaceae bacterium]|nr:pectin acetylesterase-family hydrolase [Kofleriaceae bacterium]
MQRYLFVLALAACGGTSTPSGSPPTLGTTPKQWTYVPIDGAQCINGSPTGIGVNLGTSGDLVIYLEGGGACFNSGTCPHASHLDGWDASGFDVNIAPYNIGIFDRNDDLNPLRDATFVFVPYCTGDVHAGSKPDGDGGRHFVGYGNVGLDLAYLLPKSTKVSRVVLAGSSAGGFGALINYDRTAIAFAGKPVYLLDDSGPPLEDSVMTPCLQKMFRDMWNLDAALPADCTVCTQPDGGGLENALPYLADKYPNNRLALVTSTQDGTIRSFYGYGYPDCVAGASDPLMPADVYEGGITELRDQKLAAHPNFRVYSKASMDHVWLLYTPDTISPRSDGTGEHLGTWLDEMLDPKATWNSVAP